MSKVYIALAGAGGLVIGAAGGFLFAKHKIESYYSAQLDVAVEELKEHYAQKQVPQQPFETPQEAVVALITEAELEKQSDAVIETEQYDPSNIIKKNVFETPPTVEWAEHKPRPISLAEAMSDENVNEILTVTWFEGDDTMIDDAEGLIPNPNDFLGDEWKEYFGFESGDENMVYMKNPKDGTVFEVTRDPGYYSVTVLGELPPDEETSRVT